MRTWILLVVFAQFSVLAHGAKVERQSWYDTEGSTDIEGSTEVEGSTDFSGSGDGFSEELCHRYGPYPLECLSALWVEAGCSLSGATAPRHAPGETLREWHNLGIDALRSEMTMYYKKATRGYGDYHFQCFGIHAACEDVQMGPYTLKCLKEFWLEAGCDLSGSRSPVNADDEQLEWWNSHSDDLVKQDMTEIHRYALDDYLDFAQQCFGSQPGCNNFQNGPYSLECLNEFWLEAGCDLSGSRSPENADEEQLEWWNSRTADAVKEDMALYHVYALNDYLDYAKKCFGSHPSCNNSQNGPYTLECLNEFWLESGCDLKGSSSPENADDEQLEWWNSRPIYEVKDDMALYNKYAWTGYLDYDLKCFGSEPGCNNFQNGPYPPDCLNEFWLEAGCDLSGSRSPENADEEQLEWWNSRTADAVKENMALYHELALNDILDYPFKCFGKEEEVTEPPCGYKEYPNQALYGLNDQVLHGVTLSHCKTTCTNMGVECLSFDFIEESGNCFLSSSSRLTHPEDFGDHYNSAYFEKVCVEGDTTDNKDAGEIIYKDDQCYIKYGPVGTDGGASEFDDYDLSRGRNISRITMHCGHVLDAIRTVYANIMGEKTAFHGGEGGKVVTLSLKDNEYITGIKGLQGPFVRQLVFVTNKRELGDECGRYSVDESKDINITTQNKRLAYISGRNGGYIDQLTFYFHC